MLALPLDAAGKRAVLRQLLVYHSGRILTYAALGLLFGLLGKGLAVAGLQKFLSLAAGIFMLGMAFMAWRFERMVTSLPGFGLLTHKVKITMNRLIHRNDGLFSLGLLNGLLPCGMVYAALAGAIATTDATEGMLFMALFGAGTLPFLLLTSVLGKSLNQNFRKTMRTVQPVLLLIAGLLLLQRGLHLDLSLFESAVPAAGFDCH
jgi:sulfite exporter TauE/SafE